MPVVAGTVYATRTDLGQIGVLAQALTNVPTVAQDEALQAASGVADDYLQSQFVLPLVSWGYSLTRAVCAIAAWDCLTVRGYSPQSQSDQNIRQRYEDALKWLANAAAGTPKPAGIVDSSVPPGPGDDDSDVSAFAGGSITTSPVRGWTDRGSSTPGVGDPFEWRW